MRGKRAIGAAPERLQSSFISALEQLRSGSCTAAPERIARSIAGARGGLSRRSGVLLTVPQKRLTAQERLRSGSRTSLEHAALARLRPALWIALRRSALLCVILERSGAFLALLCFRDAERFGWLWSALELSGAFRSALPNASNALQGDADHIRVCGTRELQTLPAAFQTALCGAI